MWVERFIGDQIAKTNLVGCREKSQLWKGKRMLYVSRWGAELIQVLGLTRTRCPC